jgi:radical SAM modification target selenobiotic family peptide
MDREKLKSVLAGLGIASLIAGAGLGGPVYAGDDKPESTKTGCSGGSSMDKEKGSMEQGGGSSCSGEKKMEEESGGSSMDKEKGSMEKSGGSSCSGTK